MLSRVRTFFHTMREPRDPRRSREDSSTQTEHHDLKRILEKHYGTSVFLMSERVTNPGDQSSSPYFMELKLQLKVRRGGILHINLFVKLLHESDDPQSIRFDVLTQVKKEIDVYHRIIPATTKFQNLHKVTEDELLFRRLMPKCYGTRVSLHSSETSLPDNTAAIVLEHLLTQGYHVEMPSTGFGLLSAKLAVESLAKMHAIILAMRLTSVDEFKLKVLPTLAEIKNYEKQPDFGKVIQKLIKYGIEDHSEIAEYKEAIEEAIEYSKINSWFKKSYSDLTWFTMCHGNFWMRNLMFKRNDNGHPIACRIIDFQRVEFNSCTVDLAFFLFTSIRKATLDHNFDDLLEQYFYIFDKYLKMHGVKLEFYNYSNFLHEFNNQGPKILVDILIHLRDVMSEGPDNDGQPKIGTAYRKKVRDILLTMIERHWIE